MQLSRTNVDETELRVNHFGIHQINRNPFGLDCLNMGHFNRVEEMAAIHLCLDLILNGVGMVRKDPIRTVWDVSDFSK